MKKSEKIRRKTGKMIAKNLIVLAALASVAFVGVFSWFAKIEKATASGLQAKCEAPPGIDVAIVAPGGEQPAANSSEWKTGTISLTEENYDFIKNLFLCEVTSDGQNFVSPVLSQSDGMAYVDTSATSISNWSTAIINEDYLSFDLYIRCTESKTVYLDSSTSIAPLSNITSASSPNYSKDTAVGAARFSVVDTGSTTNLLWIPAPNVYYDSENDAVIAGITNKNNTYGMTYDGTTYNDGTYTHAYYDSQGTRHTVNSGSYFFANNSNNYTLGKTSNNQNFPLMTLSNQSGDYYVNHVRCNLWLEGEDSESRLSMVGGKFRMTLKLTL